MSWCVGQLCFSPYIWWFCCSLLVVLCVWTISKKRWHLSYYLQGELEHGHGRFFLPCPRKLGIQVTNQDHPPKKNFSKINTPWEINMEHNNWGLVQMIFLCKFWCFLGSIQTLIFRGRCTGRGGHQAWAFTQFRRFFCSLATSELEGCFRMGPYAGRVDRLVLHRLGCPLCISILYLSVFYDIYKFYINIYIYIEIKVKNCWFEWNIYNKRES